MLSIIVNSLVLCAAMYLIARHEAEISFPIVLMITVGVSVIGAILSMFIGPIALLISLALLAWAVHQFCYLSWPKASLVSGIYLVTNVALAIGMQALKKA